MDITRDPKTLEFVQHYAVGMYEHSIKMCNYADKMSEPFTLYRPRLLIDGNQWCALYGENIQDGVAGFGDSPDKAVYDFNRAWGEAICRDTEPKKVEPQGCNHCAENRKTIDIHLNSHAKIIDTGGGEYFLQVYNPETIIDFPIWHCPICGKRLRSPEGEEGGGHSAEASP